MKLVTSLCTFLLFNLRTSYSFHYVQPSQAHCTNCPKNVFPDITSIKRIARIKAEILRQLKMQHLPPAPTQAPPVQAPLTKPEPKPTPKEYDYGLSGFLSSEPPDNFTDKNIIQFELSKESINRQLVVKSANLMIRIQYKKRNKKQKRHTNTRKIKVKRNTRQKSVALVISTVNSKGKPEETLASVKSKLKKTTWLKMSLPREVVQKALDSPKKTFQVYIKCVGCGKRAKLILVHKKRKRKRSNPFKQLKLHKRRPLLFLDTRVTSRGNRPRRSAPTRQYNVKPRNKCRKNNFIVDFDSIGWKHWIVSPKTFKTGFCDGMCDGEEYPSIQNATHYKATLEERTCVPIAFKPLHIVYHNGDGVLLKETLPNMIVTQCGCRHQTNK